MAYKYQVLTQEEQDDIDVLFLESQERDLYCHQVNLARYTKMLQTLEDGPWRKRIEQLKTETESRLNEVTSLIDACETIAPDRIEAAKIRLNAKGT